MIVVIVYGALNNKPTISVDMLICFSMGVAFVGLSSQVANFARLYRSAAWRTPPASRAR